MKQKTVDSNKLSPDSSTLFQPPILPPSDLPPHHFSILRRAVTTDNCAFKNPPSSLPAIQDTSTCNTTAHLTCDPHDTPPRPLGLSTSTEIVHYRQSRWVKDSRKKKHHGHTAHLFIDRFTPDPLGKKVLSGRCSCSFDLEALVLVDSWRWEGKSARNFYFRTRHT